MLTMGDENRRIKLNVTFMSTKGITVIIAVYTVRFFKVSGGLVERKHWASRRKSMKGIKLR